MIRVYFFGIVLLLFGQHLLGERVLSRERSFITPSLVVRNEVKREEKPILKIPVPSSKMISLNAESNPIFARPIDSLFINTENRKFSQLAYYSWNGGPFFTSIGAIHLPKPGSYEITYYSVDFFGNRDSGRTRILIVDADPPKLELFLSPNPTTQEEKQFCTENTKIRIVATDQLSGVRTIFWKMESDEIWKRYENFIPVIFEKEENPFSIHFYGIDHAGNVSQVNTISCYKTTKMENQNQ